MWGIMEEWQDEMMDQYKSPVVPNFLLDWDLFVGEFYAQWADPHEGEKALQWILMQQITQKTSVKIYNDLFNQALALMTTDGTNPAIIHSYEMGLKTNIQQAAAVMLLVHQNVTFHEQQLLMIVIDEQLQCTHTCQPTQLRYIVQNPIINFPAPVAASTPHSTTTASPAPHATTLALLAPQGQTPAGAGVAHQYTRLMNEE
jgi:hypothetical protein